MDQSFEGLDFDFLRYIGVIAENQRQIQQFYIPYFAGCQKVIDLGCGDADFVELLQEAGIDALGVDSDPQSFAVAQGKNLPVVQRDVFAYLADLPDNAVDGIFAAHLVEHLPFPKVLELVRQSYRVLRPGGKIVLVTPNVRSLFSHLEMFYLHFGHITFYHPRLLSFFLDHEHFAEIESGENQHTASPMLPELRPILQRGAPAMAAATPAANQSATGGFAARPGAGTLPGRARYVREREIPLQGRGLLARLSYALKRRLNNWLVLPVVDKLYANVRDELDGLISDKARLEQYIQIQTEQIRTLQGETHAVAVGLQSLNGPFEAYVVARKPE
ncbi:MAG: class I SAM-dependent methyltransferase [Litorilinea sp.]